MLTRKQAKEKISEILKNTKPIKTGATLPTRIGEVFDVYKIPLEYLVPNMYNDRITWRIREYEADQDRELDVENQADVEYLFKTIENEHINDNKKTEEDIAINGQLVEGVITNDGIIIDGNRRATLIRKLFSGDAELYKASVDKFRCFNAIVLPEDMDQKEIMALETKIQIGADKPVAYNRICLYIKVDNLLKQGYTHAQIKQYMNLKNENEVSEMKSLYDFMVEYLESIGKPNHFTLLDGLEDQFINTKKVITKLKNNTYNANWEYTKKDVANFQTVCFDYMRGKFEGKKYRDVLVGKPEKTNGVFIEKEVWDDFYKNHEAIIDAKNPQKEEDWQLLAKSDKQFETNLNGAVKRLNNVLVDKSISETILAIQVKTDHLEKMLDDVDELSQEDIERMKNLAKKFYQFAAKF